jgi:glycerophosphoryl diester phosphodiesterase
VGEKSKNRPLVLGHRGARHAAPENTLTAFDLALAEGADGVELDVRASRDGTLWVYHDPDLEIEGRLRPVKELSALEIRNARSGDSQIPTLDEVFSWQDRTGAFLNVEVKGEGVMPLDLADRAIKALRNRDPSITLLSSFHLLLVRAMASSLPGFRVALLLEEEKFYSHWLPGILGVRAVHPRHTLLDEKRTQAWRAEGMSWLGTWTVNDPARAVALQALGVDTIISDCPGQVLAALGS